jgi:hypothetical protein
MFSSKIKYFPNSRDKMTLSFYLFSRKILSKINIMRFKLKVKFHEKQSTNSIYDIGKEVNFSNLPENVQKKLLDILANSVKFKKYLEDGISDMGSVCKDLASHYLQLKIRKIKPVIKKSVELEIDATVNSITKKISGEQWLFNLSSIN